MKSVALKYVKLSASARLYGLPVPLIGLTGGIATGKSTVSKILLKEGIPLIDADQLVKSVYREEEVKDFIKKHHPEAWQGEEIHFPTLREKFFKDSSVKARIEQLIYSKLPEAFMEAYGNLGNPPFVIYDVPLLFEKHLEDKVDLKVLVYAPRKIQRSRIMDRDGHPEKMAETILKHQWDIEDKKLKADFVIDNSAGAEELAVEVSSFLRRVLV